MLHGGRLGRFRATPLGWAQRHRRNGDSAAALGTDFGAAYPRGWYSTKWWCTGEEDGTFYGVGIYGQWLWIVPEASLVVVKLSTLPRALDPVYTRSHHLAFRSLAASLVEGKIPN